MKSATKNSTDVTLELSSNMTGSFEINFLHDSLITDWQVLYLCKAFARNSSVNVKLSKIQLFKIIQSGPFLGRRLRPLMIVSLLLMINVIKALAESVFILLMLTAAASVADSIIHK